MKTLILSVLLISLSVSAQASRFEGKNGKYIMKGDSVGKLLTHAGSPNNKRFDIVCTDQKRNYCANWDRVEYWYYTDPKSSDVYWVITIMHERVVGMKWSR